MFPHPGFTVESQLSREKLGKSSKLEKRNKNFIEGEARSVQGKSDKNPTVTHTDEINRTGHSRSSENSVKPGACLLAHKTSRGQVTKGKACKPEANMGKRELVRKPATQSRYSGTQ